MMSSPVEEAPLLENFIKGDDSYRNSRFKLIPYISKVSNCGSGILGLCYHIFVRMYRKQCVSASFNRTMCVCIYIHISVQFY